MSGADGDIMVPNPLKCIPFLSIIQKDALGKGAKATQIKAGHGMLNLGTTRRMSSVADGDKFRLRIGKGSRATCNVEVVVSPAAIKQGLSGRPPLPSGNGMLFIFSSISKQGMWMIEMKFPLDIIWLDETMTVVHITKDCPPCPSKNECPTYSSRFKVKYAIELKAGDADAYGFAIGKSLFVV
jgi:uncharacterized membrane protein (UPF0127 family)